MNDSGDSSQNVRNVLSVLGSMTATRLELAAIDLEAHVRETALSMLSAFVAVVLGLVALTFIGVMIIALFWDTHRVAAALVTTGVYVLVTVLVALSARSRWKSRPSAFAGTLQQLALDREAMRRRS
jgi:uncharacterized membrane protein YqjE